jgi:hypothetical protein
MACANTPKRSAGRSKRDGYGGKCMCPACIASAALIITGIMSTGGLTALVAKKLHAKNDADDRGSFDSPSSRDAATKSDVHGKEQL